MVKICHITSAHQSNDVRIFYKECTSLAKAGYETYLVAQGESRNENGVQVIGVGDAPANRIARMTFFTKKVFKKALEVDAEIYHLHDPELLPYGLKLKKRGKKVIFDSHEFYGYQIMLKGYIPKFLRQIVSKAYIRYETHICNHIDAVVYVCTTNGQNYFNNRAKRSISIANYINLEKLPMNQDADKVHDIVYAGTISSARGITHLAKAAEKINIKLILYGSCNNPNYLDELKADFSDTIDYRGTLVWSDLVNFYKTVKIGMSTLLSVGQYTEIDTLPTKVYEYWWAGLPVIISNYSYSNKIISKYNCGICVNPEDVGEISKAIQYLLDHPGEARQMGINGRRAVEDEFNWSKEEVKLLNLYDELIVY